MTTKAYSFWLHYEILSNINCRFLKILSLITMQCKCQNLQTDRKSTLYVVYDFWIDSLFRSEVITFSSKQTKLGSVNVKENVWKHVEIQKYYFSLKSLENANNICSFTEN